MRREEAIKRVRAVLENLKSNLSGQALEKDTSEAFETLIPELKESEDERIRKKLIEYFSHYKEDREWWEGITPRDIISYLEMRKEEEGYEAIPVESTLEYKLGFKAGRDSEKQKEQKPAEWSKEDKEQIAQIERIIKDKGYSKTIREKIHNWFDSLRPQPKQEWSEEDRNNLNRIAAILVEGSNVQNWWRTERLITKDEMRKLTDWLKSLRPQPKQEWSEEDKKMLARISYKISQHQGNDERSLFTPDEAEFIGGMEDKFNSLRPQPKQEWSGEDRDILLQTAAILKANFDSDEKFEDCDYDCETLAGKLLEMRYRISPSWKPSEEQMKSLERASTNKYLSAEQYDILVSLYENLKKLM